MKYYLLFLFIEPPAGTDIDSASTSGTEQIEQAFEAINDELSAL